MEASGQTIDFKELIYEYERVTIEVSRVKKIAVETQRPNTIAVTRDFYELFLLIGYTEFLWFS